MRGAGKRYAVGAGQARSAGHAGRVARLERFPALHRASEASISAIGGVSHRQTHRQTLQGGFRVKRKLANLNESAKDLADKAEIFGACPYDVDLTPTA